MSRIRGSRYSDHSILGLRSLLVYFTDPLQTNLNGSDLSLSSKRFESLGPGTPDAENGSGSQPVLGRGGGAEALEDNNPSSVKIIELNICKVQ